MNLKRRSKDYFYDVIKESKTHYEEINESYSEHMRVAISISFDLFKGSLMAAVHALIPAFFQSGASKKIIKLHDYLKSKKRVK